MRRQHPFWMKLLSTVLACQVLWLTEPMVQMASGQDDPPPLPEEEVSESVPADEGGIPDDELPVDSDTFDEEVPAEEQVERAKEALKEAVTESSGEEPPEGAEPLALPSGEAKSAVTPQAISLPDAEGSVEGMGESFAPVLSSGTATFTVPIKLPPGRAGVQPSLSLSYSSTGGNGPVGVGWGLGVPFISRQTDRGLPRYDDRAAWHEQEDRFIYNGGQELVPVDTDEMEAIDCALPPPPEGVELPAPLGERSPNCAPVPPDVEGWQQYRARVEGAFMRFFRAPDASRWVVLGKDGTRFDFGLLPMGEGPTDATSLPAIQTELPGGEGRIFQWRLTRMTDPHGSTVYYQYLEDRGQRYLSDIYYVSPHGECGGAARPEDRMRCNAPLSDYGRHVHIEYRERRDDFSSYVSGWGVTTALRVERIDVTAAEGDPGTRTYVRRYHLEYDPTTFHSMLSEVQVEGRRVTDDPGLKVNVAGPLDEEGTLGDEKVGELLPPMRFDYSRQPGIGDTIAGFGGLSDRVHEADFSPPHSVDEGRSDLFDVNSDGLPDLVVTDPARYRTADGSPAVGVFFNGFEGEGADPAGHAGTFSEAVPMPVPGGFAGTMTLSNINVVPMDIDGEGRSELLHMPRFREYGYFVPTRAPDGSDSSTAPISPAEQGWRWTHVPRTVPEGFTDPRIDLTRDSPRIRVFDVNNDHLIDVVRTAGRRVQTWLNLGWLPDGDGRFGSATFNETDGVWELSTEPTETCVLHAGTPIDFADSEVKLADMNGDGIQDIVKMRRGRVIYWPGKGDAKWGVGPSECEPPGFDSGRHIEMTSPPAEVNPELAGVLLSDVNNDGAADVVQVRFRDVDVWFNKAGLGFTRRTTITDTPAAPDFAPRVRLTDIDGSGTLDLLYGNAHRYQWIDFMDRERPRLLKVVDNGLGARTEIRYEGSGRDYAADLEDAESCTDSSCERFVWSHIEPTGCQPRHTGPGDGDPETARCYRPNGSPLISTVVRSVRASDRFHLLGREEQVSETNFAYHDGYYEGIEQEFRGFGAADAEKVGDYNHPTSFTRTFFLQGRRPSDIRSDRLADNPNEALKGREYLSEVVGADGTFLSTTHSTYTARRLAVGLNGVAVSSAFVRQTDEFRYDTAPFIPGTELRELPAVKRQDESGLSFDGLPPDRTRFVDVRGAAPGGADSPGYAHIRSTTDYVDNLGHAIQETAHGRVSGEFDEPLPPGGERIVSHTVPENVSGSPTGWLWRTKRSFTDGHGTSVPLGDTLNTYNERGDLLESVVTVDQELSPDFSGDGEARGFSEAPEDVVTTMDYDVWGNETATCGGNALHGGSLPCLRRSDTDYDDAYSQFPLSETIDVRPEGGSAGSSLTYAAEWDRGFSVLTKQTDPNRFETEVSYDGLSRLTSVTPPAEAGCEGADRPVTRIRYDLSGQTETDRSFRPAAVPLSRITTVTELSCTGPVGGPEQIVETLSYVDGLGRARATLETGDERAAHRWVKSGVVTLDRKGTTRRTYQPAFFAAGRDDFAAAVSRPSVPYTTTRYDAFGRPRANVNEDGTASWTFYRALSTDVCDPNDMEPDSPHYATCTTTRKDGHERLVDQIERNRQADRPGIEHYRLFTHYRADNAVVQVERAETFDDAPERLTSVREGRRIEREFFYDTVKRRIASTDPDTDNRETGVTWRYLFNRVNDLVAVRDPRGCGQNFLYDHAGRLLGEQYVQCDEAAAQEEPHVTATVDSQAVSFGETETLLAVDTRIYFDAYPAWPGITQTDGGLTSDLTDFPDDDAAPVLGRRTGSTDRGQRNVYAYDKRGNNIWEARQMAVIPGAGATPPAFVDSASGPVPPLDPGDDPAAFEPTVEYDTAEGHTYVRSMAFDHADRPTAIVLPADPDWDGGGELGPRIGGTLIWNRRNLPGRARLHIIDGTAKPSHSDGDLNVAGATITTRPVIQHIDYLRDGLVGRTVYGDGDDFAPPVMVGDEDLDPNRVRPEGRAPTESVTEYDIRRRPFRMRTLREPTSTPAPDAPPTREGRPLSAVSTVVDQHLDWDPANNLLSQTDDRPGNEWPAGRRPQTVHIRHDALYRVVGAEYDYSQDDGSRTVVDDGTDWREEMARTKPNDPMETEPAPMLPDLPHHRVVSLTWEYDWLSNMESWTDDAASFYERSIGGIGNGADFAGGTGNEPALRPSALYVSSQLDVMSVGDGEGGWLEVRYGVSGNVASMTVHGQCSQDTDVVETCEEGAIDDTDPAAERDRLRRACTCTSEQHYVYEWDELNRLARARRYDREGGDGDWPLGARLRYRYDGNNQRTVKEVHTEAEGGGTPPPDRIALYVYPGDFERRGLGRGVIDSMPAYEADSALLTEAQYLVAGARIVWKPGSPEMGLDRDHRITFNIADLLQTTTAVVDVTSGALVECSTYYPNGVRESHLTNLDAEVQPEPIGFTGKEKDEEVGLVYFGQRYLIPRLARWAAPDPAQIHALKGGEEINSYHYVAGSLLQVRDPLGLDPPSLEERIAEQVGQRSEEYWLEHEDALIGIMKREVREAARRRGSQLNDPERYGPEPLEQYVSLAMHGFKYEVRKAQKYHPDDVRARMRMLFSAYYHHASGGYAIQGLALLSGSEIGAALAARYRLPRYRATRRLAGGDVRHQNAAIAEARGYREAMTTEGHVGVRGPGPVTEPGPDYVTFDPQSRYVYVWDAKYRGPGGHYPSSVPARKVQAWTPAAREAIEAMPEGPARQAALEALEQGRVRGKVFKWPPQDPPSGSGSSD